MLISGSQIRIFTDDYESSLSFYRNFLDLNFEWNDEKIRFADFQAADLKISLINKHSIKNIINHSDMKNYNIENVDFVFQVPDVTSVYNELLNKGVHFLTKPVNYNKWGFKIKAARFKDPDNNSIEIFNFCQ